MDITKFSPTRYLQKLRRKPTKHALAYCDRALGAAGYRQEDRVMLLGRLKTEAEVWAFAQKINDMAIMRRFK